MTSGHISTATVEIARPFNFISYNPKKASKSTAKWSVLEYCFIIISSAKYCIIKRRYQKRHITYTAKTTFPVIFHLCPVQCDDVDAQCVAGSRSRPRRGQTRLGVAVEEGDRAVIEDSVDEAHLQQSY